MTDITPERLAQIKARGSEIPEGPWKSIPWHIAEGPSEVRVSEGWLLCSVSSDDIAAFIAAARQDVPDLIAALEAAQAENAKLRAILWEAAKASIIVANITEANVSEEVWKQITDATTAELESNP